MLKVSELVVVWVKSPVRAVSLAWTTMVAESLEARVYESVPLLPDRVPVVMRVDEVDGASNPVSVLPVSVLVMVSVTVVEAVKVPRGSWPASVVVLCNVSEAELVKALHHNLRSRIFLAVSTSVLFHTLLASEVGSKKDKMRPHITLFQL